MRCRSLRFIVIPQDPGPWLGELSTTQLPQNRLHNHALSLCPVACPAYVYHSSISEYKHMPLPAIPASISSIMSEPDAAPQRELDATMTDATEARDQDKEDHKPRDSKGWDGKLRVDKLTLSEEPRDPTVEIQSDPEESEDEGPPPEQLPADEDLLDDTPEDEDEIELVHMKISDMASLRLERFKQMKVPYILHIHEKY
jgi:hypothetical protein